jgi:tetratricopeptide (TPR) repeat protein
MLLYLLDLSIRELPPSVAREFLVRCLSACEEHEWQRMFDSAQDAKTYARSQDDRAAEAAALIHIGLAARQLNQPDRAQSVFGQAKRIYQREPDWRYRLGEGLAALASAIFYERRPEALRYYQEALDCLVTLADGYVALGEDEKHIRIRAICDALRLQLGGQMPIVYVDGKAHVLSPLLGQDQLQLELQPNVEYRVIPVGGQDYSEFGFSSDDALLVRRVSQIREIMPGDLGVWHTASGDDLIGEFARDLQGNVQFLQPGAEPMVIGDSNLEVIDRVAACLKPTWPAA